MLGKAVAFLFGALVLGVYLSPRVFGLASRLSGQGVLLVTALVFCFVLAYLASVIGLAPIVGAYAAGLILEDAHFRPFADRGEQQLEHLVHPLVELGDSASLPVVGHAHSHLDQEAREVDGLEPPVHHSAPLPGRCRARRGAQRMPLS